MEMVAPKKRLMAGTVCQMAFTVGYLLVAPIAYFITEWRYLQVALTVPGVIFFTYWWYVSQVFSFYGLHEVISGLFQNRPDG